MANTKSDNSTLEEIKGLSESLLANMGIEDAVDVRNEEDIYYVDIKPSDVSGLLIGKQGQTLQSIQTILNSLYKQKTSEWARIVVNVADWKEKEEQRLFDLADQAAQRTIETGEPQHLYNLSAAQRRIVHMALSERTDIQTVSEGEDNERYLVVKQK